MPGSHISSILRGFRLIECLESEGPLPLKELAARAGLTPSHAHLYLASFAMLDLVGQDPDSGRYELGPYALTLGLAAFRRLDILEVAKETMRRVERETAQTVLLSIWANRGPTIVASLPGTENLALRLMVGYVLHTQSATGRVFLAHLPKWQTRPIARTERASGTVAAVATERDLKTIAIEGWSESGRERGDGYASVAVPIFGHTDRPAAVLTVTGTIGYFERKHGQLRPYLQNAAAQISQRMGIRETAG